MNGDHHARIGKEFNNEIESIKDKRLLKGKDKDRIKTAVITDLIIKHNYWKKIKEEIVELEIKQKANGS